MDRLSLDVDRGRLLALLSVVARRPVSADVLVHVEAASAFWQRGDKALANLRLVFAGLPRVHGRFDADRLQLAEWLLDEGVAPRDLMKELGIDPMALDIVKYDPDQPRVPANSGPTSGQWTSEDGRSALVDVVEAARTSFLAGTTPDVVAALAAFAARFATPTAVLGALLIPTPNSGGVTDGTLPGAPDIAFQKDGPAGSLRIATTVDDGAEVVVRAENQRGIYVDVKTGLPLGRDFGEQMYLDLDAVRQALKAELQNGETAEPKAWVDTDETEPKLCPAPTPDTPHGASDDAKNYEEDVHARVNPLAPIPQGFGVKVFNPVTGEYVFLDDCFRYAGDLVDGDMKAGDLVEAKGPRLEYLYGRQWYRGMDKDIEQAKKELDAADARGVRLKRYYAEAGAAEMARERFKAEGLGRIVVATMPPRRRR